MAVKDMTRAAFPATGKSGVYYEKIEIAAAVSDYFMLPEFQVYAIAVALTGDGAIEFTNEPREAVVDNTAEWAEWDGFSEINVGVTAFRITRNAGTVVAKVTVKTVGA